MALVYLGLGSNVGDRVGYVQQATSLLGGDENIKIVSTSSFYETEPWNFDTENWFVNAVIAISTPLYPYQLLKVCQRIENQLGRKRTGEGYEDRTIDIDILFYDNKIIDEVTEDGHKLIIPHERIHQRAFMLVPMLEIAQAHIHPVFKKTITDIYDEIDDPEMVCLYGTRFI